MHRQTALYVDAMGDNTRALFVEITQLQSRKAASMINQATPSRFSSSPDGKKVAVTISGVSRARFESGDIGQALLAAGYALRELRTSANTTTTDDRSTCSYARDDKTYDVLVLHSESAVKEFFGTKPELPSS